MHRPGTELAISRSLVQRPTTTLTEQPEVNPVVEPTGYGRPRGDASAYEVEDVMTLRSATLGPGSVGAAPWARPEEVRCLDGEDRIVITRPIRT